MAKKRKKQLEKVRAKLQRLEIPTPWGMRKVWCYCYTPAMTVGASYMMLVNIYDKDTHIYSEAKCLKGKDCCGSTWVYRNKEDEPKGA